MVQRLLLHEVMRGYTLHIYGRMWGLLGGRPSDHILLNASGS